MNKWQTISVMSLIAFLILSIVGSSPLSVLYVNASTGFILINATTSSAQGQTVPAGGTVNLYFGEVTWSGAQFYLLISTNGFSDTTGTQYSPIFTVADLTQPNVLTFTNANGTWKMGNNWVNGSTPLSIAGGKYFIKAFDGAATSVAVTGTYITITGALQTIPASGPGGATLSLVGHAFGANSFVNLTYYNTTGTNKIPIANLVQADAQGQFTYTMTAPDLMQLVTPAGDYTPSWTTITFNAKETIDEYNATYNEYARGLKQVQSNVAIGLWGNGTDLSATVVRQVGQTIQLTGLYFYPGSASVLWDGTTNIATTTVNATGGFDTNITVPSTSTGGHWIVVQDANHAPFYVKITATIAPDSYEPDDSFAQYSTVSPTASLQSQSRTIFPAGDNDYIRFYATPGTYIFYTNSSIPTYGYLYDAIINLLTYNIDGAAGNSQFKINYTILNSGYYFLIVRGNYSINTEGSYTLYFQYIPDTTPPTTTNDYDLSWHASDFTINLNATDNGTGVAATYYRINSGPTQSATANGQPLITTEGANNTLEYWSRDNVGNEELPHKMLTGIKLDKSTPTGSIQINNGSAYTNSTTVTLALLAADAVSGVSQMRFANEDSVWSSWEPYATSKSWNLTAGDGAKTVYVQYRDTVNLTVTAYQTITLDTTKPIANAGQNQTVTVGTSITFNGTGSTDNTGIASYMWDFGDGTTGTGATPTHNYTAVGIYVATLAVVDLAGNRATSNSTVSTQVIIPEISSAIMLTTALLLTGVAVAAGKTGRKSREQRTKKGERGYRMYAMHPIPQKQV